MSQVSVWIRLNVDWHESKWLAALPWEVRAVWPVLLCHVKSHGRGGCCREPVAERFCAYHDLPVTAYNALRNAAVTAGALRVLDGDLEVVRWAEYQQADPTNVDRQRRHRERKRAEKTGEIEPERAAAGPENNALRNSDNALRNTLTRDRNTINTTQHTTRQDKGGNYSVEGGARDGTSTAKGPPPISPNGFLPGPCGSREIDPDEQADIDRKREQIQLLRRQRSAP